jgi:hypothetical protein
MSLQAILWAIPVMSLTIAMLMIGIRADRITRDSLVKRARLAKGGNEVLRSLRPEVRAAVRRTGPKTIPSFAGAAAPRRLSPRKGRYLIVLGEPEAPKSALAG